MKLEAFIADRYLSSTRNSFSVSLLKWIGMLGVALGVFSLIVVISVMRGFERDFEQKILGFQAPLVLEVSSAQGIHLPTIESLQQFYPNIIRGERRIEGELVIESSFGSAAGARIRGIDRPIAEVQGIGTIQMSEDEKDPLEKKSVYQGDELPGIVLGKELAANLQVHPDFKDEVKLVFPFGELSPTGEILPRVRRFRVSGLFDSGFYDYDSKFGIIDVAMAGRLFGEYGRASLALYLKDPAAAHRIKQGFATSYPGHLWETHTWRERNQRLFQALLLERLGMLILLLMIVLIATFNIFALLSMIVLEKIKDMAVLRTVGLQLRQVRRIFLFQVFKIGVRGTVIGGTAAALTCFWLHTFPYELPHSYYIRHLPVTFEPLYVFGLLAVGPLISLIAGWYPARQACAPVISEVLRYE